MRIVLLAECGHGRIGDIVNLPPNRAKWAVAAGLARFAVVGDGVAKATPAARERVRAIKQKG